VPERSEWRRGQPKAKNLPTTAPRKGIVMSRFRLSLIRVMGYLIA
jgi:hypothetical protein